MRSLTHFGRLVTVKIFTTERCRWSSSESDSVELLERGRKVGPAAAADAAPRCESELHTTEIAVPGVRIPRAFVLVDTDSAG